MIMSRDGQLDLRRVVPEAPSALARPGVGAAVVPPGGDEPEGRVLTDVEMKALERQNILRALEATRWRLASTVLPHSSRSVPPLWRPG